jgi:hypothetical protein
MGKLFPELDDSLRAFIARQHVFFVATAPSGPGGHVNLSPKGLDSLRIIGPTRVAYLDYTGSGAETLAHVRENGRIVIMLCAFEGAPRIVRLHGRARVVEPGEAEFPALLSHFAPGPGVRSILHVGLERISDSCGFGVPLLRFENDRPQLAAWAERKGAAGLLAYQREKNATSIDGLPALRAADPGTPSEPEGRRGSA